MNRQGTGIFANGIIWFGAAVSVAEIEAGIQSGNNWAALISGHLLGGALLFLVGLIGAKARLSAMDSTASAFGEYGTKFFAALNMLQLVGWTSVMIAQGASALGGLEIPVGTNVLSAGLAVLVAVWIFIGLRDSAHIATVAMALLAVLVAILTFRLFGSAGSAQCAPSEALSFWAAFELSVAMPLSWLPLISDYTKNAERPFAATAVSACVYTVVSLWMYAIGILIAASGAGNLPAAILSVGLGIPGILIVVFSTVTTTFLDAYSAGESARTICRRLNPKIVGVVVCALGVLLAVFGIIDRYADFLYLIASVFAPMAAVLAVSHYAVKSPLPVWNVISWAVGFGVYQFAGSSPVGPTMTAMFVSAVLALCGKPFCKR